MEPPRALPPGHDLLGEGHSAMNYAQLCLLAFCGFWFLFLLAWRLSKSFKTFAVFEPHQKADWCSRVCSTVHALVIVPAMLTLTWGETPRAQADLIPGFFCFSVGYFAQDLVVILVWQVPYWTQFAVHHTVAALPYCVYLLADCPFGTDVLALFLCVELSTLPLNAQAFLEQTGLGETWAQPLSFYLTYVTWLLSRVLLPIVLMYVVWSRYLLSPGFPRCAAPGVVCAHVIALFCVSMFFLFWTPDLIRRWKRRGASVQIAEVALRRGSTTVGVAVGPASFTSVRIDDRDMGRHRGSALLAEDLLACPVPGDSFAGSTCSSASCRDPLATSNPVVATLRQWENSVRAETLGEPWTAPPSARIMFDSSSLR
eukprot:RCo051704